MMAIGAFGVVAVVEGERSRLELRGGRTSLKKNASDLSLLRELHLEQQATKFSMSYTAPPLLRGIT
jgi:hypothetical protein